MAYGYRLIFGQNLEGTSRGMIQITLTLVPSDLVTYLDPQTTPASDVIFDGVIGP